jgi:hypothetical protein
MQSQKGTNSEGSNAGTIGDYNSFFGAFSGQKNISGEDNALFGYNAGRDNLTGSGNTYIGMNSGRYLTEGGNNFFGGFRSGLNKTSGNYNTFLGAESGVNNAEGKRNTFLGNSAGYNATGSSNVFIGNNVGYDELGSDKLYIDNSKTSTPLIYGDFSSNKVGINTNVFPTDSGFTLAVGGKTITEEVKVQLRDSNGLWPDYVFTKEYNLPTLKEVENQIKEKGHLKNIPSAKEVAKEGIFLGDMNAKLLQKIEELTLYTIEQEKKLLNQENEIEMLKKEKEHIQALEKRLVKLEKLYKTN